MVVVVVVAGLPPVEEVERISVGARGMEEGVVRDFCREGKVGDQGMSASLMVGLVEEVELGNGGMKKEEEEEEEEEDTLGGSVEILL